VVTGTAPEIAVVSCVSRDEKRCHQPREFGPPLDKDYWLLPWFQHNLGYIAPVGL